MIGAALVMWAHFAARPNQARNDHTGHKHLTLISNVVFMGFREWHGWKGGARCGIICDHLKLTVPRPCADILGTPEVNP